MGKMVAVIFFFAGTYFCRLLGKWQKLQKLEPAKILCHMVYTKEMTRG